VIRPLAVRPSGRRLLDNPSGWPACHGCILVFAPRSYRPPLSVEMMLVLTSLPSGAIHERNTAVGVDKGSKGRSGDINEVSSHCSY
jgi:hypothetical protein